jgi:hypothetical protein
MERDPTVAWPQRGASTFLVLLATSLLGYLSYRLVLHASAYNELVRAYRLGFAQQQSARDQLYTSHSPTRTCTTQSTTSPKGGAQHWSVCALGTPPLLRSQAVPLPAGRIDFNALFRSTPPCQWERRPVAGTVFTTPRAAMTCFVPPTVDGDVRSSDNIAAASLRVRPLPTSHTTSLSTPGAFEIENTLTLSTSALIVAGGDVRIPHLVSNSPDRISITIVSAHGDIIVGAVTGVVSVLGLGRQLLSIPSTPATVSFPLPPFSSQPSIAGIIPIGYD